jgi:hypothetical protein
VSAIGDLVATLGMDTKPWHKGLDGAQSRLSGFKSGIESSMGKMEGMFSKFGLGAGLAGGGIIAGVVKSTLDLAEEMRVARREAETLGLSLYGFLRFQEAAEESGRSIEDIQGGLRKLMVNMDKAGSGDKGLTKSFEEVGLKVEEIRGLSPEALMDKVAVAVSKIPDPIRRARIEMELLGKAGVALDGTLKKIAAGEKPPLTREQATLMADLGQNVKGAKKTGGDVWKGTMADISMGFNRVVDPGFDRKMAERLKIEDHNAAVAQRRAARSSAVESANEALADMRAKLDALRDPQEQFDAKMRGLGKYPGLVANTTAAMQQLREEMDNINGQKSVDKAMAADNLVGKSAGQKWLAQFYQEFPNASGEVVRQAQTHANYLDHEGAALERITSLTQGWGKDMGDVDEKHRHVAEAMKALGGEKATGAVGRHFREAMKAAEEMDKRDFAKKLKTEVKGLTEGPMDKLLDQAKELREGHDQGLITREEYAAANEALRDRARAAQEQQKPKEMAHAVEFGTNEAWQQIIHQMYGIGDDKQQAKEMVKQQQKTNELLGVVKDNLTVVSIP